VDHVRFTSQPSEEPPRSEQLLHLLDMIHAEKTLMFSSDYPHWDNDDPHHAFPKLPDKLAERFFHGNAAELYNFAR
ncbi:MAG: amidohydrolase family protein, partial [Burkholderiales bacterium]|nr:amidohydrolase family protein [Opitutaceae bacterium]